MAKIILEDCQLMAFSIAHKRRFFASKLDITAFTLGDSVAILHSFIPTSIDDLLQYKGVYIRLNVNEVSISRKLLLIVNKVLQIFVVQLFSEK